MSQLMSKLLYWSPLHGQGQTSNLHVTALIMGLLHNKSVLMMQTHFSNNNLESPFLGENVSKSRADNSLLFEDIGLDKAASLSSLNMLNREKLESCCFSFEDTGILLMPGTEIKNRETFDRDVGNAVSSVIMDAEKYFDMVLIDANSGDDKWSNKLMDVADLIVINLTQRKYVVDSFFKKYGNQLTNYNVFYLFGDYDGNSCYNINNLRRKYTRYLNHKNSGVIPYCTEYLDAQNESAVKVFIKNGLYHNRNHRIQTCFRDIKSMLRAGRGSLEETQYFFQCSKKSVEKILDKLWLPVNNKCREVGKNGDQ